MAKVRISELGAISAVSGTDVMPIVHGGNTKNVTVDTLIGDKEDKSILVMASGAVNFTVEDCKEYDLSAVTSLTMAGAAVNAHGFVTFAASTPTVSVSGFTHADGDDITSAAASETWEFSVMGHSGESFLAWKNWG